MLRTQKIYKNYFVVASWAAMAMLAFAGAETMPMRTPIKGYRSPIFAQVAIPVGVTTIVPDIKEVETTTTTSIVTVPTTIITTTTITEPPVIIKPKTTTSTTESSPIIGSDGPPHNLTTLVGCISYYESRWGTDPNVFQFEQGTWESYGGKGTPENASYSKQLSIFWVAWQDDGPHNWAAQKGRCF